MQWGFNKKVKLIGDPISRMYGMKESRNLICVGLSERKKNVRQLDNFIHPYFNKGIYETYLDVFLHVEQS